MEEDGGVLHGYDYNAQGRRKGQSEQANKTITTTATNER